MTKTDYGTIEFEGKTLTFKEDAYCKFRSTENNPNEWYYASAIDDNKKAYGIWWETLPAWKEQQEKSEHQSYEEEITSEEPILEEEYACNWDNPSEIERVEELDEVSDKEVKKVKSESYNTVDFKKLLNKDDSVSQDMDIDL